MHKIEVDTWAPDISEEVGHYDMPFHWYGIGLPTHYETIDGSGNGDEDCYMGFKDNTTDVILKE